jgi:hypothetical protein
MYHVKIVDYELGPGKLNKSKTLVSLSKDPRLTVQEEEKHDSY